MTRDVTVLGTGGTIASTSDGESAAPEKRGRDLVDAVPELAEYADITVREVAQRPSFDMDVATIKAIGDAAQQAATEGTDGIVVTHGTDTMEESAYAVDLTRDPDVPIVFTGAQRRPDELSPDGPANLLTAVRAATHDRLCEAGGVYLAFDATLHAARTATKGHTSALGAFVSPEAGPVATFDRDSARFHRSPGSETETLPVTHTDATVAVVSSGAGVGRAPVESALERGVDGIVAEGTGLGNTTGAMGRALAAAVERGVPVVVTSRCHAGSTAPVYGTDGGGQTLVDRGVTQAGALPAHKARLKLMFALEAVDQPLDATRYFE